MRGDAGKPFNSIANALVQAQNNDIIYIMAPITESVSIASGISLNFVGAAPNQLLWLGDDGSSAITLLDGGDFTFSNLYIDGISYPAISAIGIDDIRLKSCILNGDTSSALIENTDRMRFVDTELRERITISDTNFAQFIGGVCSEVDILGNSDVVLGCPVHGLLTISGSSYVTCAGNLIVQLDASGMQPGGTLELYFNNILSPTQINANAGVIAINCFFSDLTITPTPAPVQMTMLNCSVQGSLNIGNNVGLDAPELQYNGAGVTLNPGASFNTTNNYLGQSAPTVTDDESKFFKVGSVWVDVILGDVYMCVDPSTGAAIWVQLN